MCGFAGIFGPSFDARTAIVGAMTTALRHRGPDGEGFYSDQLCALGHRRLAIIDLSDAASQPMQNEDGTVIIAYNGEIYGFNRLRVELEQKGHRFRSRSDTEVIVHLYEELGERCVEHLNGMFAFALYDVTRRRLLLARDHFGQKPLFYARVGASLLFASEIKALLAHPGVPRDVDPRAVDSFLATNVVPAPLTFYSAIRRLPAASTLVQDVDAQPRTKRFWLPRTERQPMSFQNASEQVDALLTESVRQQLVADVPVGVFLSGGIDSSLVLSKVRELSSSDIHAFSVGFDDRAYSELPHAKRVADELGVRLHPIVIQADAFEAPTRILEMFDEPFGDIAAIPTSMLSRAARADITVALTGDGGDELFGGYQHHVAAYWLDRLPVASSVRAAGAKVALRALRGQNRFGSLPRMARRAAEVLRCADWRSAVRALRATITQEARADLYSADFAARVGDHDPYEPLMPLHNEGLGVETLFDSWRDRVLGDLFMHKTDVSAMAASLEGRQPFLDVPLAEFASTMPLEHLVRWSRGKRVLRALAARRFGRNMGQRAKRGFSPPVDAWLRGPLTSMVSDSLLSRSAHVKEYVSPAKVRALYADHCAGTSDNKRLIWALLLLELWLRNARAMLRDSADLSPGSLAEPPAAADATGRDAST